MPRTSNQIIIGIERSPNTVFTTTEISQLLPDVEPGNLRRMLWYYAQKGLIQRIRRGIYVKENYHPDEVANKLYAPSYISFSTVLERESIVFQSDSAIHSAAYLTRNVTVAAHNLSYHKLSDHILLNAQGIMKKNGVNIASPERALLDQLYLFGDSYFDNTRLLHWDEIFALLPLYQRATLTMRVNKQYNIFKKKYA